MHAQAHIVTPSPKPDADPKKHRHRSHKTQATQSQTYLVRYILSCCCIIWRRRSTTSTSTRFCDSFVSSTFEHRAFELRGPQVPTPTDAHRTYQAQLKPATAAAPVTGRASTSVLTAQRMRSGSATNLVHGKWVPSGRTSSSRSQLYTGTHKARPTQATPKRERVGTGRARARRLSPQQLPSSSIQHEPMSVPSIRDQRAALREREPARWRVLGASRPPARAPDPARHAPCAVRHPPSPPAVT